MDFFTVRAKLIGGEPSIKKWTYRSEVQAEAKFKEVCGPLCAETWLIHWADDRSIRGKKEMVLEQHWTRRGGTEMKQESLGVVEVLDDDESLLEFDDKESNQVEKTDLGEIANESCANEHGEFTEQLSIPFPTLSDLFANDSSVQVHQNETDAANVDEGEALKILLVDDEPAILKFLDPLLGKWGHEVVPKLLSTEDHAKEIIEAVKTTAFDLVITDVCMPGMNGVRLIESIAPISPASAFIISDTDSCIECSRALKKRGIWVQPFIKPFEHQELQSLLNGVGARYGRDFRRLQRGRVKVEAQLLLADGDRLAQLLEPIIMEFVKGFDLSKAPLELRPRLIRAARRLVFYGLRLHCLLFESPYRRISQPVDIEALYEKWLVKSLTAHSQLRGYDTECRGIPGFVFDSVFDSEVEPIQKQLGLGWWKRTKNRGKCCDLFEAGILLAMMYDMEAKELANLR